MNFYRHIFTLALAFLIYSFAFPQDMLKNLQREHAQMRVGVGLNVMEPTGISLQLFGGFFCSNDDSYATKIIWEAFAGWENIVFKSDKDYYDGTWASGGFRGGLNAHIPLLLLMPPGGTIQFYAVGGIEAGSRTYKVLGVDKTKSPLGGNLGAEVSYTGRGFEMGDGLYFISFVAGSKFQFDFSESFNYFRPTAGIVLRKAR